MYGLVDVQYAEHIEPIFDDSYWIKCLKGGRGGVKSWTAAHYHIEGVLLHGWRVLCGREVQKNIRESVHRLLQDRIEALGLSQYFTITATEIRANHNDGLFSFTGISDMSADGIKSYEGYDRFWGEEAHTFTRNSLDKLEPTFRKDGAQLMFTFNPELSTDEVWVRYVESNDPEILVIDCSLDNNPWRPERLIKQRDKFQGQVNQGKREQWEFDWIWGGKTKPAVEGAIYANEVAKVMEAGRLKDVPHDPTLYTHLVWDLGYNDDMTIGFVQRDGPSIRFVDYIEDNQLKYESYVKMIRKKVEEHGYRIAIDGREGGKAWLPHDGHQERAEAKSSAIKQVEDLGLEVGVNSDGDKGVPRLAIEERIRMGRQMFSRVVFDSEKCRPLFNKLQRYARKVSKETGQPAGIKKDGNDHAGDMFTYTAVIEKELVNESEKFKPLEYDLRGIV
ncbi:MAG: phage terminase large subunit [Pseudomonadota bacterium]